MSKKPRTNHREGIISKNRHSGQQRKKRVFIIFTLLTLVVVIAVLSVVGWYYYNSRIKPYQQASVRVNDVTFDLRYYINMLKLFYGNVSSGTLDDYSSYGDQDVERFAGYVEQQIVRNEIIKQGSLALGVQIERNDVEAELKKSDIPVTDERVDVLMAQDLVEKQVPSTQPQAHVQAMLLENESVAQEAIARLQAGESFEQVANALSKIPDYKIINGDLGWVTAREADLTVGSTEFGNTILETNVGFLNTLVYDDTVSKAFGYWVIKVIEKNDATDTASATIHVKGVLVGTEQEAYDVIDRLNAGEDIDELAKQLSEQTGAADNGAEMGWMTKSQDDSPLSILFDLPLNGISAPISDNQTQTKGGYWIFNVLEKDDNRSLTSKQQNTLVDDLIDRLYAELEKDPNYKVESLLTEEMRVSAINEVVLSQGEGSVLMRSSSLPYGEVGVTYYYQLEAYGNQKGNTWSIVQGEMMAGLNLDGATGVISGTPEIAGGSSITLEVNSGHHYWRQDFVVRVLIPVTVTTSSLPEAQVGVRYFATIEVFGEANIYTWSIVSGSLPDGLSLGENTGNISGIPTTQGSYEFTVHVDDGLGKATKALSLNVQ